MKKKTLGFRSLIVGSALVFLGGCASFHTNKEVQEDASAEPAEVIVTVPDEAMYEQSLAAAQTELSLHGPAAAIPLYEQMAMTFPERAEPWSRIAKARFDAQEYGQAIVAGDEALKRDSSDQTAKSVRAVAGLRVALQSLSDLRADTVLAGNARNDAMALADAMRNTLGEEVLFPADKKPPQRKPATRRAAPAAGAAAPAAAPSAKPAPNRQPDPFGSLR